MLSLSVLKSLSLLVYPLTQAFLLLLSGLYLSCKGANTASRVTIALAVLWLWLCSMPYLAGSLMEHLEEHYPPVAAQKLPKADAIVLLGGAIRGETSTETLADMSGVGDRLIFAVAAFKTNRAPLILVTGGAREGEIPEAQLIKDLLVTMGVPEQRIVLERRNRVTRDNLRYTAETLARLGVESVLLVTSSFHMARSLLVFDQLDVEVYPAPTDHQVLMSRNSPGPGLLDFLPSVKALQKTTWAFHELVGYEYYRWRGQSDD